MALRISLLLCRLLRLRCCSLRNDRMKRMCHLVAVAAAAADFVIG